MTEVTKVEDSALVEEGGRTGVVSLGHSYNALVALDPVNYLLKDVFHLKTGVKLGPFVTVILIGLNNSDTHCEGECFQVSAVEDLECEEVTNVRTGN